MSLGPALAQWNDYVGTAAADELDVTDQRASLYQLAGLDAARWLITGVEFNQHRGRERVVVYAFDRGSAGVSSHADLLELADHQGELSVVGFELEPQSLDGSPLTSMFGQVVLRLVARAVRDVPLVVTEVHHR